MHVGFKADVRFMRLKVFRHVPALRGSEARLVELWLSITAVRLNNLPASAPCETFPDAKRICIEMAPPQKSRTNKNNKSKGVQQKAASSKPAPKSQADNAAADHAGSALPVELQQLILNIFRNSFSERFQQDLPSLLQEVKQHLYNRDFLKAFGRDDYLEAYAARWSPSRALGYAQVLHDISEHWISSPGSGEFSPEYHKIACLGGGAGAEIVAFAGFLKLFQQQQSRQTEAAEESNDEGAVEKDVNHQGKLDIRAIDIASWGPVVRALHTASTTAPPLSKYASAAAKAVNAPLVPPETFQVSFHQHDLLNISTPDLSGILQGVELVTIMFTLNELYTTSVAQTQKLLLDITTCVKPGTLLLVVDSPGSYSTISLNGAEKKYPMHWLLDHTLRKDTSKEKSQDGAPWEKIVSEESRWFRLPEGSKYPIDLENMRYQLHLFRRSS